MTTTQQNNEMLNALVQRAHEMKEYFHIPINTLEERALFKNNQELFNNDKLEYWIVMDMQEDHDEVGYPEGENCALMKMPKPSKAQIKKSIAESNRFQREHQKQIKKEKKEEEQEKKKMARIKARGGIKCGECGKKFIPYYSKKIHCEDCA